jgi:glycosyltransferase involved in cell wall biosynthesis
MLGVSILLPIHNGIEFLEESVASVFNQTFANWELLIGVNGHPENSQAYQTAKTYECDRIKVFDFWFLKGKSTTLNEMVKRSQYSYVALIDVDDIWHKQKLEIQTTYMYYYDVIGSRCVYFGNVEGVYPTVPIRDISSLDFLKGNPIINSSALIRKTLAHWEENGIEDYDLWLKLRKRNKKFYNCEEVLVKHRIHKKSAFNAGGKNNKQVSSLLKKYETDSTSTKNFKLF